MEGPVNGLRLPFPFIGNPYLSGSASRLDRLQQQFAIVSTDVRSLPEDQANVFLPSVIQAPEVRTVAEQIVLHFFCGISVEHIAETGRLNL
ncbi:hypothetical protein ACMGT0_20585 [Pseudomonas sp. RHF3.3-3]|uniref:hypothetical protein n=1 Tax=Pseudomonas sp. RHF3.3-3 TaxID=3396624 RepID=UPI003A8517D5